MASNESDEIPSRSASKHPLSDKYQEPQFREFSSMNRSASVSIPAKYTEPYGSSSFLVGHTGELRSERKTTFSMMSGPLYPKPQNLSQLNPGGGARKVFHHSLYADARGWARRFSSYIDSHIPGVVNPHAELVQQWNQFFVISCLFAVFVDPLFFFLLSVESDNKCIVLDRTMTTIIVVFRSLSDLIYFLHILLQFRVAYVVAPTSRDLVDHPKKIAVNYLRGHFFLDIFNTLPLPQITILWVLHQVRGSAAANQNFLRTAVLVQYIPRLYRFLLPLLAAGQSPSWFTFESAWANIVINLLKFLLSGHLVGSFWYLFGLQRVNQCLRDACKPMGLCEFMDCGDGHKFDHFNSTKPSRDSWANSTGAADCFTEDGFDYGIYLKAVNLTTRDSGATRYIYSLFWGFRQISTLAGNQEPSYFPGEVLFTMAIIGLGLLLVALFIGNMQNFLQGLERRRLEMLLRHYDVEEWMRHRSLPEELRTRVRQAERYNWAATRGFNEEMLLEIFPEDLQIDIRRHLFVFVKKVSILSMLDDPILDAICGKLRQKTFIKGSKVLSRGGLIDRMLFIVQGNVECEGENGTTSFLSEGDVCGEELLVWCLENCSLNYEGRRLRMPGKRLHSSRTVKCLTNVEAFALRAADLEQVTKYFATFLRSPRIQGAIRYVSPYWRGLAAKTIQVAWRYRKKCLSNRKKHL